MAITNRDRVGKGLELIGTERAIHSLARKENWIALNDPLEKDGEPAAAALMNRLGGMHETAGDPANCLCSICERKKWAEEALAYNGVVIAWRELSMLARAEATRTVQTQQELF